MYRNLLSLLVLAVLLPSCSGTSPHISVVCEENNVGNCIVKWEMVPLIKGNVKVYASTNPEHIPEDIPVATADISNQKLTIVNTDPTQRYYYMLVFGDKYRVKIAARNINITGIQNFRDLGGYASYSTGKKVRWGMLYRSAEIGDIPQSSIHKLQHIGIKTLIDLRTNEEIRESGSPEKSFHTIHIPLTIGDTRQIQQRIKHHRMDDKEVQKAMRTMNRIIVHDCADEFRLIFQVLQDKKNYPVALHCASGKGRIGIAAALILSALKVDKDDVMDDYRLSNTYFNIPQASKDAFLLPEASQEAITTVFSARTYFLNAAFEEIDRNYGSMDNYLEKGIGLTEEEIKNLQSILLEQK